MGKDINSSTTTSTTTTTATTPGGTSTADFFNKLKEQREEPAVTKNQSPAPVLPSLGGGNVVAPSFKFGATSTSTNATATTTASPFGNSNLFSAKKEEITTTPKTATDLKKDNKSSVIGGSGGSVDFSSPFSMANKPSPVTTTTTETKKEDTTKESTEQVPAGAPGSNFFS